MSRHINPFCYLIGDKALISILKILEPLNYDLREIIITKIFYDIIREDDIPEDNISLNDNIWEYDIEGHFDNY